MCKIIVIGCPGCGKSTFSRELHKIINIPLFHLDMMYWNTDKTTVGKNVFCEKLSEVLKKDKWIIDGNYASTMELRIAACDTVIFLDYPLEICLSGIRERHGKTHSDIPWVSNSEDEAELIAFAESYHLQQRPQVMRLLNKYSEKKIIIFANRSEADAFLSDIKQ